MDKFRPHHVPPASLKPFFNNFSFFSTRRRSCPPPIIFPEPSSSSQAITRKMPVSSSRAWAGLGRRTNWAGPFKGENCGGTWDEFGDEFMMIEMKKIEHIEVWGIWDEFMMIQIEVFLRNTMDLGKMVTQLDLGKQFLGKTKGFQRVGSGILTPII